MQFQDNHDGTLADLLADLETQARQRARQLENAGRLPDGFTVEHYPLTPSELRESQRLYACLMLADSPEIFCALARGEAVPRHRLKQQYLQLLDRWAA